MANSGIKIRPMLRGPLAYPGPWQGLLGQANKRIYPFPLGAQADTTTSGTTIQCGGLGAPIAVNDYIIVCNATSYGNSTLFIPDTNKIRLVTAVSGTDDDITVDAAVAVTDGDWILNIGADGATAPKTSPDLDAIETVYDDFYAATANSNGYLLTGTGGTFRGFFGASVTHVDLLITDSSGNMEVVIPGVTLGSNA